MGMQCTFHYHQHWATYIEIVEFCFCLKEKLINEQFRIHVKQSSLHTKTKATQKRNPKKAIINFYPR